LPPGRRIRAALRIGRGLSLDDPDVALHAMSALRQQLGPQAVRPYIEQRIDSEDPQIRVAAGRQLKKIERSIDTAGKT